MKQEQYEEVILVYNDDSKSGEACAIGKIPSGHEADETFDLWMKSLSKKG